MYWDTSFLNLPGVVNPARARLGQLDGLIGIARCPVTVHPQARLVVRGTDTPHGFQVWVGSPLPQPTEIMMARREIA
jgi:hypothetical protein